MTSQTQPLIQQPVVRFSADDLHLTKEIPAFAQAVVSSSALIDLNITSIKNVPYALYSDKLHLNTAANVFSSRISYGETALRSLVSLVYNVAVAVIFTALAIVTVGQAKKINEGFKKYWIYAGLAATCSTVAGIGVLSPRVAVMVNLGLIALCTQHVLNSAQKYIKSSAEKDIVLVLKKLFQELKPMIEEKLPNGVDIQVIDESVMRASKIAELIDAAGSIYTQLEHHA